MHKINLVILLLSFVFVTKGQIIQNPSVTIVAMGFSFVEGPVWKDGFGLLFTDIPQSKVYHISEDGIQSTYHSSTNNSNGLLYNADGELVLAQHGLRQVAKLNSDGSTFTPLATHYQDKRLNSPNDLALHADGSIFFTDPPYGLGGNYLLEELGYYGVFSVAGDGTVHLLDNTLTRPNGILLSADNTKLFVSDTEERIIYSWDVVNSSTVTNKQVFYSNQNFIDFDGMAMSASGFIYLTEKSGVHVISPDGELIQSIPIPEKSTNCTLGGKDGKTLFVTAGKSVYSIIENDNTGNGTLKKGAGELNAFPNPFDDSLEVILPSINERNWHLKIYNSQGVLFKEYPAFNTVNGSFQITLNTTSFPKGGYIVKYGYNTILITK